MVSSAPTLAAVTITHASTPYTFGKDLIECDLQMSCDNKASEVDIILNNSAGSYDMLFVGGDVITVSVLKQGGSSTLVFTGVVDDVKTSHVSKYISQVHVHGIDQSWVMLARLANTAYTTLDPINNPGQTIDQVVIDLITNPAVLLTVQNGINPNSLGLTAALIASGGFVQPSPVHVQNQTFARQAINDCIQELANLGLANWFVDPNGAVHFFIVSNTGTQGTFSSTQKLDETLIEDVDIEDAYSAIYNVVAVVGGSLDAVDQSHGVASDASSSSTLTTYYGIPFTAGSFDLDQVALLLHKLWGNPLVPLPPLSGEIRLDNSGTPQGGATLVNWQTTFDKIPTGSGNQAFVPIPAAAQLTPGTKYWIIVYPSGINSSNVFQLHYSGTGNVATSSDGVTWSVNGSGNAYDFKTYVAQAILYIGQDQQSIAAYGSRETVITDTTIPTFQGAAQVAVAYLNVLAKKKRILTVTCFNPDIIITQGQSVYVQDVARGIAGWFQCLDARYRITDVSCHEVDYTLMSYV